MNRIMAISITVVLLIISCGEKERIVEVPVPANCPPSAPTGVYSVNLDGTVLICWRANPEDDIEGYDVYRGTSYYGSYNYLGSVDHTGAASYCFEDLDTHNGLQFYYAVAAYDKDGLSSELSYEEVTGTPRPEGEISLQDYSVLPLIAGYDLSSLSNTAQPYNAPSTDIFYSGSLGDARLIIARRDGVEIQDYGYVGDFDAVNYAPTEGWSPSRSAEAIAGHCYIVRLIESDGLHYAKLFVKSATGTYVTFMWAYQTAPGNRDLAPPSPPSGKGATNDSEVFEISLCEIERILAAKSAIPPHR